MLSKLISSKTRIRILNLLLLNPENSYYQREISQHLALPIRAVQRELESLSRIGLTEVKTRGNRKYYSANRKFPIFEELKSILLKTIAFGDVLRKALLRSRNDIRLAFIYGSYASQSESITSDIDLFVVGDISPKLLSAVLSRAKADLQREINFTVHTPAEFKRQIRARKHFPLRLLRTKKIFLIGDQRVLKEITG